MRNVHFFANALANQGAIVDLLAHSVDAEVRERALYSILEKRLKRYSHVGFATLARDFLLELGSRYDVVHINGPLASGIGRLPRLKRPPLVIHFRSSNWRIVTAYVRDDLAWKYIPFKSLRLTIGHLMEHMLDCVSLASCDSAVANSRDTLNSIAKYAPSHCRLAVLHNGICVPDLRTSFRPLSHSLSLGYLANHYPLKGWQYFVEIVGQLLKFSPDIHIHIAGDGPYSRHVVERLMSVVPNVQLHIWGRIGEESVKADFFGRLDLFLCPTSPGTTCLEALAYGVPLFVAKRSPDIAEGMDLDEFTGCGAAGASLDSSPGEVAGEILEFWGQDSRLGAQCAREILRQRYDWAVIAQQAMSMYEGLCA